MKTKLLLLFVLLVQFAQAKKDIDSIIKAEMKSEIDVYTSKITILKDKIEISTDPTTIKMYSKEMMLLSEEMISYLKKGYRYEDGKYVYVLTVSGDMAFAHIPGDKLPEVVSFTDDIRNHSENIKLFWCKRPDKIKKNLAKIDKALKQLES